MFILALSKVENINFNFGVGQNFGRVIRVLAMRGSFVHFSYSVCAGRDSNREIIYVHIDIPFSLSV